MENPKEQEIERMVKILKQLDYPRLLILSRDANTLLLSQQAQEASDSKLKIG